MLVLEMHVLLHPYPLVLEYLPSILSSLPPFQLLSFLHGVTLSLTLSLEHLAPLYAPLVSLSTLQSRVEAVVMNAHGLSNQLFTGEIAPLLDGVQGADNRREVIQKLKDDIVQSLVNERIRNAKT